VKRPQPRNDKGKFVARRDPDRSEQLNRDERVTSRRLARQGLRLDAALFGSDRKIAAAVRARTQELAAEWQTGPPPAARALISSVVLTQVRRDTMQLFLAELGPRAFSKARRAAFPIVKQLNETDALLATLLKQFHEMRMDSELEQRIEALEKARTIEGGASRRYG
jgi:hypothetical protein